MSDESSATAELILGGIIGAIVGYSLGLNFDVSNLLGFCGIFAFVGVFIAGLLVDKSRGS